MIVRSCQFLQPDDHAIGMITLGDSSVRYRQTSCMDSDDSITSIPQDEREPAKQRYPSRGAQPQAGDLGVCLELLL